MDETRTKRLKRVAYRVLPFLLLMTCAPSMAMSFVDKSNTETNTEVYYNQTRSLVESVQTQIKTAALSTEYEQAMYILQTIFSLLTFLYNYLINENVELIKQNRKLCTDIECLTSQGNCSPRSVNEIALAQFVGGSSMNSPFPRGEDIQTPSDVFGSGVVEIPMPSASTRTRYNTPLNTG